MAATTKARLTTGIAIISSLGLVALTAKLGQGIPFWLGTALLETALLSLSVPLFANTRSAALAALQLLVALWAEFVLAASFVPPQCYGNIVEAALPMLLVFPVFAIRRAWWMTFTFLVAPVVAYASRRMDPNLRAAIATFVLVAAAAVMYVLLLNAARPGDSCAIS